MFRVISTEFLKLRRSKILLLAIIASIIPAMVKYLQYVLEKKHDTVSWKWFLASHQEFTVLIMLMIVVLISSFVISMEYQYNTAPYIFTSGVSKTSIFIAKIIAVLAIIVCMFAASVISELLFGYLTLKSGLPLILLIKLMQVTVWYIFSYFLLSIIVVMLTVLTKRFVVSAVVVLGYIIMSFPFHLKNNIYICPFMTPTAVAAKLYNSNNYIFTNYYSNVSVNNISAAIFITVLAIVSFVIGIICYKKQDAIK